jgi:3-hydroxyisobutyrate dehydrogenase
MAQLISWQGAIQVSANLVVAVLGAGGSMGSDLARNIARAGMGVRAWNRTRDKAEPLAGDGAVVAGSPTEAAEGADVVLTMLPDADAVLEAMESALPGTGKDAVWLQMSTLGEQGTEWCIQMAGGRGLAFVDAPVLGTRQPAQEGKLVVLASGPDELRERVQPVFDAVGQRTMWVGPAGSGSRLKLATNIWVLTITEGCAEAIAFTEGMGLDPALLIEAISGGPLDSPYFQLKSKAITERSFEPQFKLRLAAKDASLMEDAMRGHHLDLPLVSAIARQLVRGAEENPDKDMSASYLTSAGGTAAQASR